MKKNKTFVGFFLIALLVMFSLFCFADDQDAPPPPKKNKIKWLQNLASKADSSSDQSTTVAGVRGLEEVGAAPDLVVRDWAAITRLDAVVIKDDELKAFASEGKLQ